MDRVLRQTAVAVALLLGIASPCALAAEANGAPSGFHLQAVFSQRDFATYYQLAPFDPNWTIEWSLDPPAVDAGCDHFVPVLYGDNSTISLRGVAAEWHHGDADGCNHQVMGPEGHLGNVTARFWDEDKLGSECVARYYGTNTGSGPNATCFRQAFYGAGGTFGPLVVYRNATPALAPGEPENFTWDVWNDTPVANLSYQLVRHPDGTNDTDIVIEQGDLPVAKRAGSINTTGLAPGTYGIVLRAGDASGVVGRFEYTFVVDNATAPQEGDTAPVVRLLFLDNTSPVLYALHVDPSTGKPPPYVFVHVTDEVKVTWSASDPDGDPIVKEQINYAGDGFGGKDVPVGSPSVDTHSETLPAVSGMYTVSAWDSHGRRGETKFQVIAYGSLPTPKGLEVADAAPPEPPGKVATMEPLAALPPSMAASGYAPTACNLTLSGDALVPPRPPAPPPESSCSTPRTWDLTPGETKKPLHVVAAFVDSTGFSIVIYYDIPAPDSSGSAASTTPTTGGSTPTPVTATPAAKSPAPSVLLLLGLGAAVALARRRKR